MTHPTLTLISSMATKGVLTELLARQAQPARLTSVGGVEAARRVQAGEPFDGVVLAADALDRLIQAGHVLAGSRVDLVRSGVAVAVRAGSPRPALDTPEAVRAALLAARTIGCSTGPSGVQLAQLFARWGIAERIQSRLVTPPPGTPVGALIAAGAVELGFQQLSELQDLPGVDVLGPLPEPIQIVTVFAGGATRTTRHPAALRALLTALAQPDAAPIKRAHGMDAA